MPDETKETAMANANADVSEAQIAVHWKEEEYYYPTAKFVGQAKLTDPSVNERFSIDKFPECFKEYADMLSWDVRTRKARTGATGRTSVTMARCRLQTATTASWAASTT
jgi:hypothetical protein